jgi:hypothetical protein
MNIYLILTLFWLSGFFAGAMIIGQLVGWWARRNGIRYVANHLEITKP